MKIDVVLPSASPRRNLLWLALIRFGLLAGFWIFIVWADTRNGIELGLGGLYPGLLILTVLTLATLIRSRLDFAVSEQEFLGHLLLDIGGIGTLFYFIGGATNPFISYLLIPTTIAAAILPVRHAWLISSLSVGAYSLLLLVYQPLPELAPMHHGHNGGLNLHVVGMWVTFTVSTLLITGFVTRMASGLREREAQMQQRQEREMQDEQLLSLASLAANTMHELGTPLTTIKLLAGEMCHTPPTSDEVNTLVDQVALCQSSLQKLGQLADHAGESQPQYSSPRVYIEHVIEQWQLLRPESPYVLRFDTPGDFVVQPPAGLRHSIINLLTNAAKKSQRAIQIAIKIEHGSLMIEIRDYGELLSPEVMERLGKSFITSGVHGLGIGLYLTHATVRQYGGQLRMFNLEDGVKSELRVPLSELCL